jgi:hypothetical protein
LNRGHADLEGSVGHDFVLAYRLAGDERGEDHHDPGFCVELALSKDFVEGEVVEDFNQLQVG